MSVLRGGSALSSDHLAGTDVSPGAWVAAALRDDRSVASLVPPVFEAYARVLHPAVRYAGDDDVDVRWDEVAAYNGTTAHRLMQWPAITGSWEYVGEEDQPDVWNDSPAEGHLPAHVAAALGTLLAALLATVVLRLRNRRYKRIHEDERADFDRDGIPDVYQRETVDDRADHRRDRDGGPPPGRTAGGSAEG